MFGSLVRRVATSEGAEHRRAPSTVVDAVEFCIKNLVGGVIFGNHSRQVVDDIAENQDIVSAVIVYASSFRGSSCYGILCSLSHRMCTDV